MRPSAEFRENASGPYVIPLRAPPWWAEKRKGEPSRPALLGAGNSSSSLKAAGGGGRPRTEKREGVKTCPPLASQPATDRSAGHHRSWTGLVGPPGLLHFTDGETGMSTIMASYRTYNAVPGHQAPGRWAVVLGQGGSSG